MLDDVGLMLEHRDLNRDLLDRLLVLIEAGVKELAALLDALHGLLHMFAQRRERVLRKQARKQHLATLFFGVVELEGGLGRGEQDQRHGDR